MTESVFGEYFNRTIRDEKVIKQAIMMLLITVLFGLWAFFKGVLGAYLIALIPIFILNILIIAYGRSQNASGWCVLGFCIINLCSAMSQASIGYENSRFHYIVALVVTIVFMWGIRKSTAKFGYGWIALVMGGLAVIVFLACRLLPERNGAHAWIEFAGFNFQVTEIAKIFYVVFAGLIMSIKPQKNSTHSNPKKCPEFARYSILTIVTIICCVICVLLLNEFGTALVMFFAWACASLINFKTKSPKVITIVAVILVIAVAVVGYNMAEERIGKWSCPDCETLNHSTLTCKKCDREIKMQGYNFRCEVCQYTTFGDQKIDNSSENCKMCQEDKFFEGALGKICKKIYERGSVTYNYEYVKAIGDTYHMDKNQQSIKAGKLFGNIKAPVAVPNVDTDSVIAGVMNKLGLVFAIIILLAYFMVFISIGTARSPLRIMALFTFLAQALFTFSGTLNLLPMTGIGLPLISRGGTNITISLILITLY